MMESPVPLAVTLPAPVSDPSFDAFRQEVAKVAQRKNRAALARMEIEKGLSGPFPGSPAPYVFTAHFYFQNLETLMGALTSAAPRLLEDIPNFTNISPIVQIGEIVG